MRRLPVLPAAIATLLLGGPAAHAATSAASTSSPMAGNGHNVNFDGRLFIVRQGPNSDQGGWKLMVFRPGLVEYQTRGRVDVSGAFSPRVLIQPWEEGENALAICEPDPDDTPYRCNDAGDRNAAGPYDCYDLWIFDSNAYPMQYKGLRRRQLKVWVADLDNDNARLHKHEWTGARTLIHNTGGDDLVGIEPTVTRDGKLIVWQGHPQNDGTIDILMYATNPDPCAGEGWRGPHVISHAFNDPNMVGSYRIAERQLRGADGTVFADNQLVHGAYPWLFPDGDALTFTGTRMPCRAPDDPVGCGPRRNSLSVIGYPTNWGVGHIDGPVNPSTEDTVRLFFSSPGATSFAEVPLAGGMDVWPMFGSNTSNYTEVVFDDGLDGNYAGVWHFNESIDVAGDFDLGHTPDTSGYFNTGIVHGATFPATNTGPYGKVLEFDGSDDWVEVPADNSLDPVNALTVEMWVRPDFAVDCDGNNNFRVLLAKGPFQSASYSLVLEEGEGLQARVRAGGSVRSVRTTDGLTVGEWVHVAVTYDGATGELALHVGGEEVARESGSAAPLDTAAGALRIGGNGSGSGCPNGAGTFHGAIDEVRVSRLVRDPLLAREPGNYGSVTAIDLPPGIEASSTFEATVHLTNTGTTRWAPALLHRLGSQGPQDNDTWGATRFALDRTVQPGERVTVPIMLTAPDTVGDYDLQLGMLQEGVEWFGEHSPLLSVEVVEPGTGTTSTSTSTSDGSGPTTTGLDEGGNPASTTGTGGGSSTTEAGETGTTTEATGGDGPEPLTGAGMDDTGPGLRGQEAGCGCRSERAPAGAGLALLFGLGTLRRRRSRGRA